MRWCFECVCVPGGGALKFSVCFFGNTPGVGDVLEKEKLKVFN